MPLQADLSTPVGILGGTFDPVHFGHLRLAEEAREVLGLKPVIWIPAGRPPHRAPPDTPAEARREMVRLAIEDNPAFMLDDSELRGTGPSYTVVTLERIRQRLGPAQPLVLLLGVDAFLGLPTWYRWRDLFALSHLGVADRPGYPLQMRDLPEPLAAEFPGRLRQDHLALRDSPAGCIVPFDMTPLAISATRLRAAFESGRSGRYLLPDRVREYIEVSRLYRHAGAED
jgi:nicotinate-nucleotide adenylyltransferase